MKVNVDQTCDFAEQWRHDGLFVQLSPSAIQFATDWANICIASLLELIAEKQKKKKEAAAAAAQTQADKPSGIVLTGADS